MYECLICGAWSTRPLSMNRPARKNEVCPHVLVDSDLCLAQLFRISIILTSCADKGGRSSPAYAQQVTGSPPPLLRLATSPHDTHLLATFAQDSTTIRILDVRQPGQAILELKGHSGPVNCVEWSPFRRGTLASGADDCQVLIWDLINSNSAVGGLSTNGSQQQDNQRSPVANWECEYEIGNIGWVPHLQKADHGEWLGVSAGRGVWGTRLM